MRGRGCLPGIACYTSPGVAVAAPVIVQAKYMSRVERARAANAARGRAAKQA